ncbi:hypothetical protein D3C71_2165100 [compost metagenome]
MHLRTEPTRSKSGASPAPCSPSGYCRIGDAVIKPRRRHFGARRVVYAFKARGNGLTASRALTKEREFLG